MFSFSVVLWVLWVGGVLYLDLDGGMKEWWLR